MHGFYNLGKIVGETKVWKMSLDKKRFSSWKPLQETEELIRIIRPNSEEGISSRKQDVIGSEGNPAMQNVRINAQKFRKGGEYITLEEILRRVLRSLDPSKWDEFFITMPYFSTTKEMLLSLAQIIEKKQVEIHKVEKFISSWVERYPMDFRNTEQRGALEMFVATSCVSQLGDSLVGKQILANLTRQQRRHYLSHCRPKDIVLWPFKESTESKADILLKSENLRDFFTLASDIQCTHREIAMELSIISEERANLMHERDYINQQYKKEGSFRNQSKVTERYCNFVATNILLQKDKTKREKAMRLWIKIAYLCFKLRNFVTVVEIMTALSIAPIYRLNETKNIIAHPKFKKMHEVMSYTSNYGTYRQFLKVTKESAIPYVPYMGLIFKDLYGLERSSPKILLNNDERKTVLYSKCVKISRYMTEVLQHKRLKYEAKSNTELRRIIQNCVPSAYDMESLFQLSYLTQAPKFKPSSSSASPPNSEISSP